MYTTGCEFLDEQLNLKGIPFTDYKSPESISICEACPYPEVNGLLKCDDGSLDDDLKSRKKMKPASREVTVQCTGCHTQETLIFRGSIMDRTKKFEQVGDEVYHNCNQTKCIIIKVRSK